MYANIPSNICVKMLLLLLSWHRVSTNSKDSVLKSESDSLGWHHSPSSVAVVASEAAYSFETCI